MTAKDEEDERCLLKTMICCAAEAKMIAKRKARRKEPMGIYNKVRKVEVKKKSFVCVSL